MNASHWKTEKIHTSRYMMCGTIRNLNYILAKKSIFFPPGHMNQMILGGAHHKVTALVQSLCFQHWLISTNVKHKSTTLYKIQ